MFSARSERNCLRSSILSVKKGVSSNENGHSKQKPNLNFFQCSVFFRPPKQPYLFVVRLPLELADPVCLFWVRSVPQTLSPIDIILWVSEHPGVNPLANSQSQIFSTCITANTGSGLKDTPISLPFEVIKPL